MQEPLNHHPLHVVLTRPPMIFGLTQNAFVLLVFAEIILFFQSGRPETLLSMPVLYIAFWFACRKDIAYFSLLSYRPSVLINRKKVRSYEPQ